MGDDGAAVSCHGARVAGAEEVTPSLGGRSVFVCASGPVADRAAETSAPVGIDGGTVEVARTVRGALDEAGYTVRPFV